MGKARGILCVCTNHEILTYKLHHRDINVNQRKFSWGYKGKLEKILQVSPDEEQTYTDFVML